LAALAFALIAALASAQAAAPADGATTVVIVTQDQAALRAAARDSAQQQALLWQGDLLELRGERVDHLQVYDHRRERAGFVRATQVRRVSLAAADAPELLAVLRFLRDQPGSEALGIAYAAAYLRAAPVAAIDADPFDAIGAMAERLARRASARQGQAGDTAVAAHLEVVAGYGVIMNRFERDGRIQQCYDGDAYRRVLAMQASVLQQARAVLALTRHDCIDPRLPAPERQQLDEARAELLERVDLMVLPDALKNRIRMRRAGVWSAVAFARARHGEDGSVAAQRAIDALAAVDKAQLGEADATAYADAALRTSASLWAAEPAVPATGARLALALSAGRPGETCLALTDAQHDAAQPLLRRCSFGRVWSQSVAVSPSGNALAVAVQPLAGWRELWVFHRVGKAWVADALPASTGEPELGVIEFAGWVPGGTQLLVAREARVDGRFQRSFELLRLDTLATVKRADRPEALSSFQRWQDPRWRRLTVSLR